MKLRMFLLFVLVFITLRAQTESSDTLNLSLEKSIYLALENNNDYMKAKLDRDIAIEKVREAYGTSLFPNIKGTVDYNRAIKQGVIIIETPFFSGSFPQGTQNTLTGAISLEQPLFTGAMFLAVDIAETFAEISKKNSEYSESELIVNVKSAYYDILLAKELVELTKLNLNLAEQNYENTRSMYNAGLASEYDKLKSKVQYQNLIPALTEVKNQFELACNNLKIMIGVDIFSNIKTIDRLEYTELSIPDIQSATREMIQQNELLKQLMLDTELKDLTASYEFTQHLPKLNLTGRWQAQAQENDTKHFSDWFYVNSFYVGLSLSVPIFNGFATDSKVEQAELNFKKSEEEFEKVRKQLTNQLHNTLLTINADSEKIDAYKSAVTESERGYEIANKRYRTGLGTQLEVTSALVDFSQSKVNYLTSIRDYYVHIAALNQLLGRKN
ncbi:MAG: TolC family protein [Melioribacteraceae bacterium]|nr:TolC family protein [Melioribacteraceae bacterium]MCF8353950.1 TolC family protein [Melioribacteraceae bacterium]MCF8393678.1 TolC family protein [Melioribacteraceae bacterium]MCF8419580.1 TolC family protein [Melioribacteraceae bacterium]